MIETIPFIEKLLVGEDGVIHRVRITIFRNSIWLIMVLISFLSNNIIEVLNFTGSGFTPVVSYFGPLYYSWAHIRAKKLPYSNLKLYHDVFYFILSVGYSGWGLYDLFRPAN